jgi:hypothetical protein
VHHEVRVSRRRANILRNYCLAASAAFRAIKNHDNLVREDHLAQYALVAFLMLPNFCAQCHIFALLFFRTFLRSNRLEITMYAQDLAT